jgi:hypothetical protein
MSREQLVEAYLRGEISRRVFIRRLAATGMSLSAAIAYSQIRPDIAAARRRVKTSANFYETSGAKVTYGGQITTNLITKGSFGGNAQGGPPPKGEEEYIDHGAVSGLNFHSTDVTSVDVFPFHGGKRAVIRGQGTVKRTLGTSSCNYEIVVTDFGSPGTRDTYRIRLTGGVNYDSGEHRLDAGNVTVH